jgi:predicted DNA-binding ribbon-helix-helix protein
MCRIFAGQPRENYDNQTRSVRLGGHSTSIRLEAAFWHVLEEVAESQGMTLAKFLTMLYDEVLELHGEVRNFASLLRCACLTYVDEIKDDRAVQAHLREEARTVVPVPLSAAE